MFECKKENVCLSAVAAYILHHRCSTKLLRNTSRYSMNWMATQHQTKHTEWNKVKKELVDINGQSFITLQQRIMSVKPKLVP
jgi:hypothetical protein